MAKVTIEVLDAEIDGHAKGAEIEVDKKSAEHLIAIGYAKAVETQPKAAKPKAEKKSK